MNGIQRFTRSQADQFHAEMAVQEAGTIVARLCDCGEVLYLEQDGQRLVLTKEVCRMVAQVLLEAMGEVQDYSGAHEREERT